MNNLTDDIIKLLNEKLISERTCLRYLFVKGETTYLRSIKRYKLVVADPYIDNTDDMLIPNVVITPAFATMVRDFLKQCGVEDVENINVHSLMVNVHSVIVKEERGGNK